MNEKHGGMVDGMNFASKTREWLLQ